MAANRNPDEDGKGHAGGEGSSVKATDFAKDDPCSRSRTDKREHCLSLKHLLRWKREGQEDQLGALDLVVNIIVLWNTIYMDAALNQLRAEGFDVREEDVARLSPLGFEDINMLGRYAFTLPTPSHAANSGPCEAQPNRAAMSKNRFLHRFSAPLLPRPRI